MTALANLHCGTAAQKQLPLPIWSVRWGLPAAVLGQAGLAEGGGMRSCTGAAARRRRCQGRGGLLPVVVAAHARVSWL